MSPTFYIIEISKNRFKLSLKPRRISEFSTQSKKVGFNFHISIHFLGAVGIDKKGSLPSLLFSTVAYCKDKTEVQFCIMRQNRFLSPVFSVKLRAEIIRMLMGRAIVFWDNTDNK